MNSSQIWGGTGVHPDDIAALTRLVAGGVRGNLVLLHSTDGDPAPAVAAAAAAAMLTDEQALELDVHVATPAGDRWTVGEIDELIVAPARLKAFERTHVIVTDADAMSGPAADHLLKTVEEPGSDALFWFCVREVSAVPATLRGRAAAELPARPAPVADRIATLIDAGADATQAAQLAALAGADLRLALAALADQALLEPLTVLANVPLRTATPTSTAAGIVEALAALALAAGREGPAKARRTRKSVTPAKRKPSAWAALTPVQKAHARRQLRAVLERLRAQVTAAVPQARDATTLRACARAAAAIDACLAELGTNAPPQTALAALFARTA